MTWLCQPGPPTTQLPKRLPADWDDAQAVPHSDAPIPPPPKTHTQAHIFTTSTDHTWQIPLSLPTTGRSRNRTTATAIGHSRAAEHRATTEAHGAAAGVKCDSGARHTCLPRCHTSHLLAAYCCSNWDRLNKRPKCACDTNANTAAPLA